MEKKQTTSNEENPVSAEIRKLESQLKRNHVAVVILQIFVIGIVAGAVYGLIKGGIGVFFGILFLAAIFEGIAYSLFREDKGVRKRLERERSRPVSSPVFSAPLYKNKGYTRLHEGSIARRQVRMRKSFRKRMKQSSGSIPMVILRIFLCGS